MAASGFKDYYSILGVAKGTPADELKKAYRQLARKYHPDVNPGDKTAEERFKEVSEAYEILSDPDKRKKYDQFGQYWKQAGQASTPRPGGYPGGGTGDFDEFEFGRYGNFDEFINDLLGRMGNNPSPGTGRSTTGSADPYANYRGTPPRGAQGANLDSEAALKLTLSEAFHGVQKRLSVGSEVISVNIPAGAKPGSKIRVRGKGQFSPHYTTQRGDLYLIVDILAHKFFQFDGDNLTCEVPIAPDEAVLGAQVEVPTLEGLVTVSVPAGVKSGQSLRLRGKGWKSMKGDRSDLMAKITIVPPKELTAAEREAYEQVRSTRVYDPRISLRGITL